jgi:hypothetical protein
LLTQALAVDRNELHVGCESGKVFSGDLFLKGGSSEVSVSVMPHSFSVLTMAMQAAQPGRSGSIMVGGAPRGLAALNTFSRIVAGSVAESMVTTIGL